MTEQENEERLPLASGYDPQEGRQSAPSIMNPNMTSQERREAIQALEREIYDLGDRIRSLKLDSLRHQRILARQCRHPSWIPRTDSCCRLGECPVCTRHWPFWTGYTSQMQELYWLECAVCGWKMIDPLLAPESLPQYPPNLGSPRYRPDRPDSEVDIDDDSDDEAGAPSSSPDVAGGPSNNSSRGV